MPVTGIPTDVVEFVSNCVHSIEELDVLVLLAENPGRSWTVAEVDQEIRSTPKSVQIRLENLHCCGMLKLDDVGGEHRYTFEPQSAEAGKLAAKVLSIYKTHRLEIIEIIYSSPARSMVSFSHAFKIRGKKDGDS